MPAIFLILAMALGATPAWSRGDSFNNGGGLGEASVAFVLADIESLTAWCLAGDACQLPPSQQDLLQRVLAAMPSVRAGALPIFLNEADAGGLFAEGPVERPFATNVGTGAQLYFNLDKIYHWDPLAQSLVPLTVNDAVGLVMRAVAVQLGDGYDSAPAIALEQTLAAILNRQWLSSSLAAVGRPEIVVKAVAAGFGEPIILVADGKNLVAIQADVLNVFTALANNFGFDAVDAPRIEQLSNTGFIPTQTGFRSSLIVDVSFKHHGSAGDEVIGCAASFVLNFKVSSERAGEIDFDGTVVAADPDFAGSCARR